MHTPVEACCEKFIFQHVASSSTPLSATFGKCFLLYSGANQNLVNKYCRHKLKEVCCVCVCVRGCMHTLVLIIMIAITVLCPLFHVALS